MPTKLRATTSSITFRSAVKSRKRRFTTIILAKDLSWVVRFPKAVVSLSLRRKKMQRLQSESLQKLTSTVATYWCGRTVTLHRGRTEQEEGRLQPLVAAVLATGFVQSARICNSQVGASAGCATNQSQSLGARVSASLENNLG